MFFVTWGMIGAGVAALVAGLFLVRARFAAASGAGRVLVLGPVFEAVALTIFAAEHFLIARGLSGVVPRWIPGALFWTYFVGAALLAAAISFIAWRYVRWSAFLLALLFLIIVATIDLPNLPKHTHERLFWTLTVRETAFAGGAMVLAGSLWPRGRSAGTILIMLGRLFVACTLHILCDRALSLPPVRAWCSVGKDDAGVGASADAGCLYRWHNFARRRRWADDSPRSPHRRRHRGHSASATHDPLLRSDPYNGDPFSTRGGRGQLCGRYPTVRSDSFVGGLQRELTENLSV
jgi:uncharacterized membrane protein